MHAKLSTVEIKPTSTHRYSIIWLHGLGADGHDFEGIVPELKLKGEAHIHFIFPDAPIRSVTINGGMNMRAWYDIIDMSLNNIDILGIYHSSEMIQRLIRQEIASGIPAEHIMLAGFSQGGVIALHAGLTFPDKLAGIIGLSTYLPTYKQLASQSADINNATPVFLAHGIIDSVVPIHLGKRAFDTLNAMNITIEWHDFVMDHSVCADEIVKISDFINSAFRP